MQPGWITIAGIIIAALVGPNPARAQSAAARVSLDAAIVLTPQPGTEKEDRDIQLWQARAKDAGAKVAVFERLGWAYVAKARRTLDAGYYKLAERTADVMDARFGASADSRLLRGHVLHNLHRFAEAEKIAAGLAAERGSPDDYGLWSDTLMEQGRLDEAVTALQHMVDLRPGLESYSRIAHLRWLKGDLAGATRAMEDAVHAGSPRDAETYSWTLTRLSLYYLQAAQAPRALLIAEAAARYTPDYPPALLAEGRALLALGRTGEARAVLPRAAGLNPLPEYQWWLADTERLQGAAAAAATEAALLARGEAADPRTLALYLATRGVEPKRALALAEAELGNRQDVFTHDAVAWAAWAAGDLPRAERESALAGAEHTADARLYFHAAGIALATGRVAAARELAAKARTLGPTLTPGEAAALARIRGAAGSGAPAEISSVNP